MIETSKASYKLSLAAVQYREQGEYWNDKLSGSLVKSVFPYDYSPGTGTDADAGTPVQQFHCQTFQFPGPLSEKILKLSKGSEVKLHIIMVTGLFVLLSKYTGHKDIIIGTPIIKQESQKNFINTVLALRNDVHDYTSFKELLLELRETIIQANENQNYPIEILLKDLNLPMEGKDFPLFDVVSLVDSLHDKHYLQDIPYNMGFSFYQADESLEGEVEYNSRLYHQGTIKQIIRHYIHVLTRGISDVNVKLSHIELLSEEEKKQVLFDFNSTGSDYPDDKTLHRLFAEQVERTPDRVALVGKEEAGNGRRVEEKKENILLTYKELNEKAGGLAYLLKEKGVRPDTIAAIMVEPSPQMMIGIWGILKAGGAYLPIDPDYPEERIKYMLADSGIDILLTFPGLPEKFEKLSIVNCQLSLVNEKPPGCRRLKNPPKEANSINNLPLKGNNLAYVMYTSGSTGRPKGVMVEHGNVTAYIHAFCREFNIDAADTVIQLTSYAFDAFVEEVFPVLSKGGKLVLPDALEMVDVNMLSHLILQQCVTIADCTPVLLNEFNKQLEEDFAQSVRLFISGGHRLKPGHVNQLVKIGKVYNTYGPTETTVCVTYFDYSASPGMDNIPIGKPISNYRVYILDDNREPVPIGVTGELCVSGDGVTRGYLNRPELTAESFCLRRPGGALFEKTAPPEPSRKNFSLKVPGKGIYSGYHRSYRSYKSYNTHLSYYKTGDLGRWLSDGNIEFSGRKDNQVKIRGYRVELTEIENCLCRHERIEEAVVTTWPDKTGEEYLCAYVTTNRPQENDDYTAGLRDHLLDRLPVYMIPTYFIPLDEIPLNPHGKIDKNRLPHPEVVGARKYVPPGTLTEKKLVDIYSHILELDREKIGINNGFFELGGNSLLLIKLLSKISEVFKTRISIEQIFKDSTIKYVANCILSNKLAADENAVLVQFNPMKPKKIFCFPPGIAFGIAYMELATFLEEYSLYAFNYIDDSDKIRKYADTIIELQPDQPYVLFGYSAGGKLCLKTARILEKKGLKVSSIILLECYLHIEKIKSKNFNANLEGFYHGVRDTLSDMAGRGLTEKVIGKIKNYGVFYDTLKEFEPVNAAIHLIRAEDKEDIHEPLGWEKLALNEYKVYRGFGTHEQMLNPGYIEKNSELIIKILEGESLT